MRLLGQLVTALLRRLLVDGAGPHVRINRHLLTGHGVEGKTGRNFRNTFRAFGDHDKLHNGDDKEDDRADDEVAADNEVTERVDDLARVGLEKD